MDELQHSKLAALLHRKITLVPTFRRLRGLLPSPLIPFRLTIRRRWVARLVVAAVSVASAGAFVLIGFVFGIVSIALPTAEGACTRIRDSHLGPDASDWFCHLSLGSLRIHNAAASLFLAAGFALACLILVAAGRRLSAFLPLLGTVGVFAWVTTTWGINGEFWTDVLIVFLLALPALALLLVGRTPRAESARAGPTMLLLSAVILWIATWAEGSLAPHLLPWAHAAGFGLYGFGTASMVMFSALLGTNRRWWPWSLALLGVLLSGLPTELTLFHIEPARPVSWYLSGLVIPLFLAGLLWSAWRPLAERLARWRSPQAWPAPQRLPSESPRRHLRPIVVLNALAAVLLVVSRIMTITDPTSIWIATPLATYQGERTAAYDLRARLNLQEGLSTMDAYFQGHDTYAGFTSALGHRSGPQLAWGSGIPDPSASQSPLGAPSLVVSILRASPHLARLGVLSGSGRVFCIEQQRSGGITFGESPPEIRGDAAWTSAIASCGATSWTSTQVRPLPSLGCDPTFTGYIICRMVQVLIHNVMAEKKPQPPSPWTVYTPPGVGQAEPVLLSNGLPGFIVEHRDGSLTLVDAVSPHQPWGIGQVVSWCFASKTFGDTDGSTFNEYGHYLSGPAPSGLITYRLGPVSSGQVPVLGTIPALPRSASRTPGVQGSLCTGGEGKTPARSALVGISATPAAASTSSEPPDDWTAFWGTLLIEKNKQPELCSSVANDGSCQGPVTVAGVDPSILAFDHKHRIMLSGTWLALVTDKGLTNPVYVGPAPSG